MRKPKITIFTDKRGEWRFNFKAKNGKIVAASEGYKTYQGCVNGYRAIIEMVSDHLTGNLIEIDERKKK